LDASAYDALIAERATTPITTSEQAGRVWINGIALSLEEYDRCLALRDKAFRNSIMFHVEQRT